VDSVSKRGDRELAGRTDGNTVVNFRAPADMDAEAARMWLGRLVPVRVTRAGPHSLSGEVIEGSGGKGVAHVD